jgi:hypothetical protein
VNESPRRRRCLYAGQLAIAFLVASTASLGQINVFGTEPYGYFVSEQITTNLPTTTTGGGGLFTFANPHPNDEIFAPDVALFPVSHGDSVTAIDPVSGGLFTVSGSAAVPLIQGVGQFLHASALTSGYRGRGKYPVGGQRTHCN